jgi:hypothetical protein
MQSVIPMETLIRHPLKRDYLFVAVVLFFYPSLGSKAKIKGDSLEGLGGDYRSTAKPKIINRCALLRGCV